MIILYLILGVVVGMMNAKREAMDLRQYDFENPMEMLPRVMMAGLLPFIGIVMFGVISLTLARRLMQ